MNVTFTVLCALPFGFFIKQRGLAVVAFMAADAFLFAAQTTLILLLGLTGHPSNDNAFSFASGPEHYTVSWPGFWSYVALNAVIALVGIGLVVLGNRIAAKRTAKRKDVVTVG